jgi:hypothetical protein
MKNSKHEVVHSMAKHAIPKLLLQPHLQMISTQSGTGSQGKIPILEEVLRLYLLITAHEINHPHRREHENEGK